MLKPQAFSILRLALPFIINKISLAQPAEFLVARSGTHIDAGIDLSNCDASSDSACMVKRGETYQTNPQTGLYGTRMIKRNESDPIVYARRYGRRSIAINTAEIQDVRHVGQYKARMIRRNESDPIVYARRYGRRGIAITTVEVRHVGQNQGAADIARRDLGDNGDEESESHSETLSRRGMPIRRLETRNGVSDSPEMDSQRKRKKRDPHHTSEHSDDENEEISGS